MKGDYRGIFVNKNEGLASELAMLFVRKIIVELYRRFMFHCCTRRNKYNGIT